MCALPIWRPRAADRPCLVGQPHVLRVGVGLRVHRHRGDAEPARGADYPACDFAAVGDEDLFKHACLCSEALPFKGRVGWGWVSPGLAAQPGSLPALLPGSRKPRGPRSEEHTSELQSLMRISYAVFCLKKKKYNLTTNCSKEN